MSAWCMKLAAAILAIVLLSSGLGLALDPDSNTSGYGTHNDPPEAKTQTQTQTVAPPPPITPSTRDVKALVDTYTRARTRKDVSALQAISSSEIKLSVPGAHDGRGDLIASAKTDRPAGAHWSIHIDSSTITTAPGRASANGRYTVTYKRQYPTEFGWIRFNIRAFGTALKIARITRYPDEVLDTTLGDGTRFTETARLYVRHRAADRPLLLGASTKTVPLRGRASLHVRLRHSVAKTLRKGSRIIRRTTFSDGAPPFREIYHYTVRAD